MIIHPYSWPSCRRSSVGQAAGADGRGAEEAFAGRSPCECADCIGCKLPICIINCRRKAQKEKLRELTLGVQEELSRRGASADIQTYVAELLQARVWSCVRCARRGCLADPAWSCRFRIEGHGCAPRAMLGQPVQNQPFCLGSKLDLERQASLKDLQRKRDCVHQPHAGINGKASSR